MPAADPPAALELTERDFELLAPARARSEEWNADRLELKRRLGELGSRLVSVLDSQAGLTLERHTSLHHPTSFNAFKVDHLRVYLSRGKRARAALKKVLGSSFRKDIDSAYRHACFQVDLGADSLETGLTLHPDAWWDAQNLVGRAGRGEGARELVAALKTAPGFTLRIHEHRPHPAEQIRRDELERALKHFQVGQHYLRLTRSLPRAEVLAGDAGELEAGLTAQLLSLVTVYRALAWSPDNDHLFAGGGGGRG